MVHYFHVGTDLMRRKVIVYFILESLKNIILKNIFKCEADTVARRRLHGLIMDLERSDYYSVVDGGISGVADI